MRAIRSLDATACRALECPWCGATANRGVLGVACQREGRTVGVLVLAPAAAGELCPPGSYVIERVWVAHEAVRSKVGTHLLRHACGRLRERGGRVLMAAGTRGVCDCGHPPAGWLEANGFRELPGGWRLDLRQAATWASKISDAVDATLRGVRRGPTPEPAGRVRR